MQLLTTLYSLGPEVSQCELVQEYERSGRKDIVRPTDKCKEREVKKLTIRCLIVNILTDLTASWTAKGALLKKPC